MDVTIRKARPEELKTIQDLNHDLFKSDYSSDTFLNKNWPYKEGKKYFQGMISGENGVCYVAEINSKIVGYLAGSIKKQTPSYRPIKLSEIENMFVKENYRNKGIGEKLAKLFLQWSKDNGAARCFVSAYTPNVRAITFYNKVGFQPYSSTLEVKVD